MYTPENTNLNHGLHTNCAQLLQRLCRFGIDRVPAAAAAVVATAIVVVVLTVVPMVVEVVVVASLVAVVG